MEKIDRRGFLRQLGLTAGLTTLTGHSPNQPATQPSPQHSTSNSPPEATMTDAYSKYLVLSGAMRRRYNEIELHMLKNDEECAIGSMNSSGKLDVHYFANARDAAFFASNLSKGGHLYSLQEVRRERVWMAA